MSIGRHKFSVGKNFEVENFKLLKVINCDNDIFGNFLEWKWASVLYILEIFQNSNKSA